MAPQLKHPDQKGFVPGRQIHELTQQLTGSIDLATARSTPLAVVTLTLPRPLTMSVGLIYGSIGDYGFWPLFHCNVKSSV